MAYDLFNLVDESDDGTLQWSEISTMFDRVSEDNLNRATETWEKLVERMLKNDPWLIDDNSYTYDQVLQASSELLFEGEIYYYKVATSEYS